MLRIFLSFLICLGFEPAEAQSKLDEQAVNRGLVARAGDRSVALHWDRPSNEAAVRYDVYRGLSADSISQKISSTPLAIESFADLQVTNGVNYFYAVRVVDARWPEGPPSIPIEATPHEFRDDREFLDLVAHTAFDYFWYEANPTNGLIRDRSRPSSPCSIAAVGLGLTGIGIAIDHGWITREAGRQRAVATFETLYHAPQGSGKNGVTGYKGWFYHFLDMNTAARYRDCELSSIDTALLLAGILYAEEYFDSDDASEQSIRSLADSIYKRVDWQWMTDRGSSFSMGWFPDRGFLKSRWIGYNEAMILLVLGLGAPEGAVSEKFWSKWINGYKWETNFGFSFVQFGPLFGHQYSHCWIDFRNNADDYMQGHRLTYFENSRRATLAQRNYAIANPKDYAGYSSNLWGLTACDGPGRGPYLGYSGRGLPPEHDDGTIAPTAAGASIAFTPVESIEALRMMYTRHRVSLWTGYGFRDAFNQDANWWDPDVLAIDQGPILIMIENYLNGGVWKRFMRNESVKRGLERAGFKPFPLAK